ncbi:LOW QUALITY PROTEIN: uncharacterized protein J5F26_012895 [Ciconia maguari]
MLARAWLRVLAPRGAARAAGCRQGSPVSAEPGRGLCFPYPAVPPRCPFLPGDGDVTGRAGLIVTRPPPSLFPLSLVPSRQLERWEPEEEEEEEEKVQGRGAQGVAGTRLGSPWGWGLSAAGHRRGPPRPVEDAAGRSEEEPRPERRSQVSGSGSGRTLPPWTPRVPCLPPPAGALPVPSPRPHARLPPPGAISPRETTAGPQLDPAPPPQETGFRQPWAHRCKSLPPPPPLLLPAPPLAAVEGSVGLSPVTRGRRRDAAAPSGRRGRGRAAAPHWPARPPPPPRGRLRAAESSRGDVMGWGNSAP